MPFAVTHILVPMIQLDIFRDNILKLRKEKLPNRYILLAGLFGLIPDVDIPISLIVFGNLSVHRYFTHSLFFPLIFLLASLTFHFLKKQKWFLITLMCFTGIIIHIFLDFFLLGTVHLFYPLSVSEYGLNLIRLDDPERVMVVFASLDAVLLFTWFLRMEFKKRIEDIF